MQATGPPKDCLLKHTEHTQLIHGSTQGIVKPGADGVPPARALLFKGHTQEEKPGVHFGGVPWEQAG